MSEEIKDGQEVVEKTDQATVEPTQVDETNGAVSTPEQTTDEVKELPEDVKERTKKEFEKLKKSNAELKKQLDEQKNLPSVLDFLNQSKETVGEDVKKQYVQPVQMPNIYQQQPPQAVNPEPSLVDDEGYVNAEVLKKELAAVKEANKRALEAEERARRTEQRISQFEVNAETKNLYKSYPELDPNSESLNKDAYDLVRNELTSQIVNTGKRNAIEAANKMSRYFRKQENPNQQAVEQRSQVATTDTTSRPVNTDDCEELMLRSRHDPDALAERLRRLGL